jgi:hypothetical protein
MSALAICTSSADEPKVSQRSTADTALEIYQSLRIGKGAIGRNHLSEMPVLGPSDKTSGLPVNCEPFSDPSEWCISDRTGKSVTCCLAALTGTFGLSFRSLRVSQAVQWS